MDRILPNGGCGRHNVPQAKLIIKHTLGGWAARNILACSWCSSWRIWWAPALASTRRFFASSSVSFRRRCLRAHLKRNEIGSKCPLRSTDPAPLPLAVVRPAILVRFNLPIYGRLATAAVRVYMKRRKAQLAHPRSAASKDERCACFEGGAWP